MKRGRERESFFLCALSPPSEYTLLPQIFFALKKRARRGGSERSFESSILHTEGGSSLCFSAQREEAQPEARKAGENEPEKQKRREHRLIAPLLFFSLQPRKHPKRKNKSEKKKKLASLFAAAKRFVSYVTGAADEGEVETEAENGRRTAASSSARRRERSSGGSGSGGGGGGAEGAARTKRAHLEQRQQQQPAASRLQPLLVDAPLGTGGVQGSRGLERAQRRDSDGDLAHAFFDAEALRWKEGSSLASLPSPSSSAAAAAAAAGGGGASSSEQQKQQKQTRKAPPATRAAASAAAAPSTSGKGGGGGRRPK